MCVTSPHGGSLPPALHHSTPQVFSVCETRQKLDLLVLVSPTIVARGPRDKEEPRCDGRSGENDTADGVERCPVNVVRVEGRNARAGVGGRRKRRLRRVGGGGAAEARRTLSMPSRRLSD